MGSRPCRDKDQEFTGTIDVVADGVVVAAKRVRVTVPKCRYHYSVEVVCGEQPPSRRPSGDEHDSHGDKDDHGDDDGLACAVVAGLYATAVTIYNPSTCTAVIEKRFAPLVLHGKTIGREPDQAPAQPFAKIELEAGHATMDDCCALEEAIGKGSGLVAGRAQHRVGPAAVGQRDPHRSRAGRQARWTGDHDAHHRAAHGPDAPTPPPRGGRGCPRG